MLDRVLAGPGNPCSIVWCEERKEWAQFDEFCGEIMQCTGLKDKNGREIYEGDIVRLYYSDGSPHDHPAEIKFGLHHVGFDSDISTTGPALGFYLEPYPDSDMIGIGEHFNWEDSEHRFEVIGNIWEHPSLMDSTEKADTAQ